MRLSSVDVESKPGSSNLGRTGNATMSVACYPVAATTGTDRQIACGAMTDPPLAETAEAAADFESVRSRLFGIAYRMLGRAADAEDVVQDVWIRWQGADRARVRDRVAFLATVTTRVALNAATSARVRREVSAGVGLPERDYAAADPAEEAVCSEELGLAFHLLIERLSPVERAVYVLREAFEYPFRDIAEVLELSEANSRQLARRARMHVAEQRDKPVDPARRNVLLKAFLDAARAGDMAGLIDVLTNAVVLGPDRRIDSDLSTMRAALTRRQRQEQP
jgi:RNA polymerase sigma factor (sigma-70 family)